MGLLHVAIPVVLFTGLSLKQDGDKIWDSPAPLRLASGMSKLGGAYTRYSGLSTKKHNMEGTWDLISSVL
jgi:hypothetical protein